MSAYSERVKANTCDRLVQLEQRLSVALSLPVDQLKRICKEKAIQAAAIELEKQIEMQSLWMKKKVANIHRASSM